MKNDSRSYFPAEVDVAAARSAESIDLGLEFTNEIDVWTQMEFRSRHQIKQLRLFGHANRSDVLKDLAPFFYGTRLNLE